MRRLLGSWLVILSACGQSAHAQAEPDADAVADGESSEGQVAPGDADELEDGLGEDGRHERDDEVAAATAKVDAAIEAAKHRGETELLAVAQQRNELTAVSAELDARLATIATLEGRIDELLGAGKVERDHRRERIDLLANLIATMSPQAAATMLAQMSDAQAQDLLLSVAQSDKRKAAKLIATMPPSRAAAIGQRYLTRDPATLEATTAADAADPLPPPEAAPAKRPPAPEPAAPAGPTAQEPTP